jgi:NlpC/P60 family putative phage cell wall peptidase
MSAEWRPKVVAEAQTWLNTPYHHGANIKGVGVDCAMYLVEVFRTVGVIEPDFDPRPYPKDWMLHRSEEIFMAGIFKYAKRIKTPEPGDVALYRVGRTASHGAIVIDSEVMAHAYAGSRKVELCELDAWANRLESYWTVR